MQWIVRLRVPLGFLVALLLLKKIWDERRIPHDPIIFLSGPVDLQGLAGLLIILMGIAFRGWATGVVRKGVELSRLGPYSIVRHPLYLGSLLVALGFCTILGDMISTVAVLVFATAIYWPIVLNEERHMTSMFPDYSEYASRTPALIPYRPRLYRPCAWSFRQYVHHREYRLVCVCIIAIIIIDLIAG